MIRTHKGIWTTRFSVDLRVFYRITELCEICRNYNLDKVYVYIIECLREANLLPEDYKKICCSCFIIKEKLGGNYHKGCTLPLRMKNIGPWSVNIICTECDAIVGRIIEADGELISEIYHEVEGGMIEI